MALTAKTAAKAMGKKGGKSRSHAKRKASIANLIRANKARRKKRRDKALDLPSV
jgi:hypothetical protein